MSKELSGLKTIKRPERLAHWTAIYTTSRSEKKVAERLEKQGLEVYCPTVTTLRNWSDRKKKVIRPVFSSYVFIKVSKLEHTKVLQESGVVSFVKWLDDVAKIKEEEIEQLKRIFGAPENIISTEVINFKKGDQVKIHSLNFLGQEGVVEDVKGKTIRIIIDGLGMEVRVTLKTNEIDLIG